MIQTTVIGYGNLIDSATLAGGDWQTGAGANTLNNLKTRYLRQPAVSDGATTAATQFTIDLGSEKTIGLIALCTHNLTVGTAQITITGSNSSGFTTEIAWRGNNMLAYAGGDFAYALPPNIAARYWKVEISDTINAAGYISIGRVFIGPAFVPLQGLEFGSSIVVESRAGINESWSGMEHFEQRRNRRVWRGQFNHLLEAEANEWLALCRSNDVTGEVYVIELASRGSGNLLLNPDTFGAWTLMRTTLSANTDNDPFGIGLTADTLTETTDTGIHYAYMSNALYLANATAAANEVTLSCYVKSVSSGRYPVLQLEDTPTYTYDYFRAHFDTVNRTALTYNSPNGSSSITDISCKDAGNGWTRLSVSGRLNMSGQSKTDARIYFDNAYDVNMPSYAGDTGKSMVVWGAMLNHGGLMDYVDANHPMTVDSTGYRGARSFLGRLRALSPIEWPYVNQFSTAVEISEVL